MPVFRLLEPAYPGPTDNKNIIISWIPAPPRAISRSPSIPDLYRFAFESEQQQLLWTKITKLYSNSIDSQGALTGNGVGPKVKRQRCVNKFSLTWRQMTPISIFMELNEKCYGGIFNLCL